MEIQPTYDKILSEDGDNGPDCSSIFPENESNKTLLMKGNPEDPLMFKRPTLLSVILNMVETLAHLIMSISNQHCLLNLNIEVQDLIFFL